MEKKACLLVLIFSFVICANITAQTNESIGKIFTKAFADSAFGKVYFSYQLGKDVIKKVMDDTTDILAFKMTKKDFEIFNKYRKAVYPDSAKVGKDEPCYLVSKDKIKELLDRSKSTGDPSLEMRASNVTITSGALTIEQTCLCPPICP